MSGALRASATDVEHVADREPEVDPRRMRAERGVARVPRLDVAADVGRRDDVVLDAHEDPTGDALVPAVLEAQRGIDERGEAPVAALSVLARAGVPAERPARGTEAE